MSTKSASFRYGNTKGSQHKGEAVKHIGFAWAKDFNKNSIHTHFTEHGSQFDAQNENDYKAMAIKFANTVDKENNVSFIDTKGSTYKYNKKTNILCIIDKNGYVISYFKPKTGKSYYYKEKKRRKK